MKLESVRELKSALQSTVLATLGEPIRIRAFGVPAGPMAPSTTPPRTLALGVVPGKSDDYRLAVRIQRRALEESDAVKDILRKAHGEADVRYIGRVFKRAG